MENQCAGMSWIASGLSFRICRLSNAQLQLYKEKLVWLIENPEERTRFGRAGWEFAKGQYDRNENCQELWDLYLEILGPSFS